MKVEGEIYEEFTKRSCRHLAPGKSYVVIKSFTDYDGVEHPTGEEWIFRGSNFNPYDDGQTLYAEVAGETHVFRLQDRPEEQGAILEKLEEYLRLL